MDSFSLEERKEKLTEIFLSGISRRDEDVRSCWSKYLERNLHCPFVCRVQDSKLVDVIKIDWTEFIASVIELTDNEGETKSSDVNLSLLFPISLPEDKVNSEALDHFRFFLNNLWFPWDEENDDERDSLNRWFQEHFQNRFENLTDYQNGSLENDAFIKMKKMARNYTIIEQEINDIDVEDDAMKFAKLSLQKESIEKLSMVVENPEMYNQYQIKRRRKKQEDREFELNRGCSIDRQACLVWTGGQFSTMENYITNCKNLIPFENPYIILKDSLQSAIDVCVSGDVIFLCHGHHVLEDLGDLKTSLNIHGVGDLNKIHLELDCGILEVQIVSTGSITLENMTIIPKQKTKSNGISLKNSANMHLKQCKIKNFSRAIEICDESSCVMKYGEISGCDVGVTVEENASFHSIGGLIEDVMTGIRVETFSSSLPRGVILDGTDNYGRKDIEFVKPRPPIIITKATGDT